MVAVTGPLRSRRVELLALTATVVAAIVVVVAPVFYVIALPAACAMAALVAPRGRRTVAAAAIWFPISVAVLLGTSPIS